MKKAFTILYTDDMHSSLIGMGPAADYTPFTLNDDTTRGGYALRSLTEMPQANADGSYDLYFGLKGRRARKACGQDHPGQRVVCLSPHLRPASAGLRRDVEAQRHRRGEVTGERHFTESGCAGRPGCSGNHRGVEAVKNGTNEGGLAVILTVLIFTMICIYRRSIGQNIKMKEEAYHDQRTK